MRSFFRSDNPKADGQLSPIENCALLLCAIGYFAHILLAEPTLNMLGFPYGDENANLLAKIHPGNFFIFAAFVLFIVSRGNPVERLIRIARDQTAFFTLLVLDIVILIYWFLRSPRGVGLILDVHMPMPICVILFSYASHKWCRAFVVSFAVLAIANSGIGMAESLTHMRLFPFDTTWEVLHQSYFRASALMGHPLVNAAFTAVSIFVVLSLRMPTWLKAGAFAVMLSALVGFGGRSSFGICVLGLLVLGVLQAWRIFTREQLSVLRLLVSLLAILTVPLLCGGLLYVALDSGMGERLMAYSSLKDESAAVRVDSWRALSRATTQELFTGMGNDRVDEIGNSLGVAGPTSDIENPWVLMFMFLGGVMFVPWLLNLIACLRRLVLGAPLPLVLAVFEYFIIASTSNSFGRKDPLFILMPGIVICAKRLLDFEKK